nr:putative nuclease HARBI1 [Lytechinus pictus]
MAAILVAAAAEAEEVQPHPGRVLRDREQPLDSLTETQLLKRYRFGREAIFFIINLLTNQIAPPTERNQAIHPTLQVLISLNFFATGSVLESDANIHRIHRSTVSRVIHRVSQALCEHKSQFIKFPRTDEETAANIQDFYRIARFPRVVGAVDGTHVCLHGCPLGPDEYVYTNRKGRSSINVQLACNTKFQIINVVARWPGSTHDSRVLQNSRLYRKYNNGELKGIILGDSGYPLMTWLMTPILNPQTPEEQAYNNAQCKTRSIIEQLNGQLKNKFRCLLGHGLQIRPNRACSIITACCILFNISKRFRQPAGDDNEDDHMIDDNMEGEINRERGDAAAIAVRAQIVQSFVV